MLTVGLCSGVAGIAAGVGILLSAAQTYTLLLADGVKLLSHYVLATRSLVR
jgi:hypothetical protein